jgi:possible flagellar biosynthesis protein fliR
MLVLFSFIVMRMTGAISLNPIFGRTDYPRRARAALIFMLSVICYLHVGGELQHMPGSILEYGFMLLKEFFVGFCLGFAMELAFLSLRFATSVMDFAMGLNMAQVFDPSSGSQATVSTGLLYGFMMLLFFSMDGHLRFLELLFKTIDTHPFGGISIKLLLMPELMLSLFVRSMKMGLELAFPIMGLELMSEVALGILMRIIPQINIFAVNFQLKIILGFSMLYFLLIPIADKMKEFISFAFESVIKVIGLL